MSEMGLAESIRANTAAIQALTALLSTQPVVPTPRVQSATVDSAPVEAPLSFDAVMKQARDLAKKDAAAIKAINKEFGLTKTSDAAAAQLPLLKEAIEKALA